MSQRVAMYRVQVRLEIAMVDIAQRGGYFDRPHLLRDWRHLVGCTPQEWWTEESDLAARASRVAVLSMAATARETPFAQHHRRGKVAHHAVR